MADHKLKLGSLTALVIGSMIGGGIFSLPKDMASGAEVGAILIGWAITGVGIIFLGLLFFYISRLKPNWTAAFTPMRAKASAIWWALCRRGATGCTPPSASWAIW